MITFWQLIFRPRRTNLLYWLLFAWLSEAEPLFPGFWLDTLWPGGHVGEHRLRLAGGVSGALTAAPFHPVVPVHAGASVHYIVLERRKLWVEAGVRIQSSQMISGDPQHSGSSLRLPGNCWKEVFSIGVIGFVCNKSSSFYKLDIFIFSWQQDGVGGLLYVEYSV